MTNRERHHNGRFKPMHQSQSKCFGDLHRLRRRGWKVSWFYYRVDRKHGLLVAAVAKGPAK